MVRSCSPLPASVLRPWWSPASAIFGSFFLRFCFYPTVDGKNKSYALHTSTSVPCVQFNSVIEHNVVRHYDDNDPCLVVRYHLAPPFTKARGTRGGIHFMHIIAYHRRSPNAINPRIPTMPGRSTLAFHRPGRHRVHQARSAMTCSAGRMKSELHPAMKRLLCGLRHR